MSLRVISYGGGVQSTALGVLAAEGRIGHVDAMLFANVGDDSEHPATLAYVRDVFTPWAAERGMAVHELHRRNRQGEIVTLRQDICRTDHRSVNFPLRFRTVDDRGSVSWAPGNRKCSTEWKHKVVRRWCRDHGASNTDPARVLIGISLDEIGRIQRRRPEPSEIPEWPLVGMPDQWLERPVSRDGCEQIIRDAGLPVPPKSSCHFCPYRTPQNFAEMRRDDPVLFDQAVEVEEAANATRRRIGKDEGRICRTGIPLRDVTGAQDQLFAADGPEQCDDGFCWT